ncbi:hypothetical protein [Bradyrhizobium sp. CCBAU 21360]|uniref:hypothetical protein n=1 Tax=Bradyrhizobium sp. CCBAU 21360 TaxID=1325081 RepID=UPI0023055C86|nr:hypothetical protein [Bradyrhizobium sp. CCBAU 21360]
MNRQPKRQPIRVANFQQRAWSHKIAPLSTCAASPHKLVAAGAATSDRLERALPFTQPVGPDGKVIYGYPALAFRQADSDFRDAYNVELNKLRDSGKLLKILEAYGFTESELPPADVSAADLCK